MVGIAVKAEHAFAAIRGNLLAFLSKDLIKTKKITYIDIEMRLYFPIRRFKLS